jgi:hypothetical protein
MLPLIQILLYIWLNDNDLRLLKIEIVTARFSVTVKNPSRETVCWRQRFKCLNPTVLDMSQLPRWWRIHLAAGILVFQVHIVLAIISLFYIDHRLIVIYIIFVDYIVSKCDSEAARGKLNSLSDPNIHGVRFRARSIIVSYRVIVLLSYRIVSY